MRFGSTILVGLLFVVGLTLTVLAATSSEHEYRFRLRERQDVLAAEARVRARLVERWIETTWNELESAGQFPTPHAIEDPLGGWLYDETWPPAVEPSVLEQSLYRESLRGGESYEFRERNPASAVDAYSFYLPRIENPTLRARLQFYVARATRSLGDAMFESIAEKLLESTHALENGTPVAVAAALLIANQETTAQETETNHHEYDELAWRLRRQLPTAVLDSVQSMLAPNHEALAKEIDLRRTLEVQLTNDSRPGVRLLPEHLLLTRSTEQGLRATLLESPFTDSSRFEYSVTPDVITVGDDTRASAPVRLDGEVLGWATVEDKRWDSFVAGAATDRNVRRWLIGSLAMALLIAGALLFLAHRRQHALAQLRARLLTNVSHELKTPVTSLRMFSELIREDTDDADAVNRFAEIMCAESIRLSQLIDNLLDYSRHGRKSVALETRNVDLAPVISTVSKSFAYRAAEERVDFDSSVEAAKELDAITDPRAVEQITLNLLDNALKYRSEQSPRIQLRARRNGDRIHIAVEDNGIGISPDDHERVFEEFYRARFEDYGVQGSGLGLAISRRLAEKLGGRIELMSTPGQGSTFLLDLPAVPQQNTAGGSECTES